MKNYLKLFKIIIVMVIGLYIIGCGNNSNPSVFVGKWELEEGYFQFNKAELFKDGTGIVSNGAFTWKVIDKRLVITHPFFALACDYKISGNRITLTTDDGDSGTFVNINKVNENIDEITSEQPLDIETIGKIQNNMKEVVQLFAQLVKAEELDIFHKVEDMEKPEYQAIKKKLIKFANDYDLQFAYYWRGYGNRKFQFIIDNDLDPETIVGPGDIEEIIANEEFKALAGNVTVTSFNNADGFGGLMSAYAPVYDRNGNIYCVAGIDVVAENWRDK